MGDSEVTPVEIARLAGVGRAAVSNWRRRYDDFPRPVGGTATSPRFALAEVEAWLRRHGRVSELPAEERAWQHLRALAAHQDLPEAVLHAAGLIFGDAGSSGGTDQAPLAQSLADLTAEHGRSGAFELLLHRLHEAVRLPRLPQSLAHLMTGLIDPGATSIFDPACGTGDLLAAARARFPEAQLFGDEADPTLRQLAQLRLAGHGAGSVTLRTGGLRQPADPPLAADAALCALPQADRDWSTDELTYDPRWRYGVPPKAEPELAWLQHILANLRPGGRAVVLLPPATAARPSGRRVRAELLRRGALQAVVGLPPGLAPPHHLGLHLWVLRRPELADRADRFFMAELPDAAAAAAAAPAGAETAVAAANRAGGDGPRDRWRAWGDALAATFAGRPAEAAEAAGLAVRRLRVMDLLDDEVDLTPARQLHTEPEPMHPARVNAATQRLQAGIDLLRELLPVFDTTTTPTALPMITIGDLARTGAVSVLARSGRQEPATEPAGGGSVPLWRARDVLAGHGPAGQLAADELPAGAVRVMMGDVVAPTIGHQLIGRVVTDEEAGAVLGANLYLLRPDAGRLDPWFLAGFLRWDSNSHRAGSLGSIQRYDVRRAQVPRIPLADQRRYGALFRRLHAFGATLAEVTAASGDLHRLLTEGLAAGIVAPATNPAA